MRVSFEHDQDPRYGWASVDIGEKKDALLIVHSLEFGSLGFKFRDGEMTPTCICSAWSVSECSCPNVDWSDSTKERNDG